MSNNEIRSDISVIVPFHSNVHGLAATLVMLQAQIIVPRSIFIIDTSPNKLGLALSRRYYTGNVPTFVERAPGASIYEAWNKGIDLAGKDDVFIINDDLLLPMNVIDCLDTARTYQPALAYVPMTPPRDHYAGIVDTPYYWYSNPTDRETVQPSSWMPGFAFMLTRDAIKEVGLFNTDFKVWYGDTDYEERLKEAGKRLNIPPLAVLNNTYVYHFGGSSYKYDKDRAAQQAIIKDQELFNSTHPYVEKRK